MCSKINQGRRSEGFQGSWSDPEEQPGVLKLRLKNGCWSFGGDSCAPRVPSGRQHLTFGRSPS